MKCSYCNKNIPEGTGILYVKKDGTAYNFCSGKCEINMLKLKRKASKVKWITKSKEAKESKVSSEKKKTEKKKK
jgi:large subunit ribosomal protein L24e